MSNKHHWAHQSWTIFRTVSLTSHSFAFTRMALIFESIIHFTSRLMPFVFCPSKPPVRINWNVYNWIWRSSPSGAINYSETIQDTHCRHRCFAKCYLIISYIVSAKQHSLYACTAGRSFRRPWGSTLWGASPTFLKVIEVNADAQCYPEPLDWMVLSLVATREVDWESMLNWQMIHHGPWKNASSILLHIDLSHHLNAFQGNYRPGTGRGWGTFKVFRIVPSVSLAARRWFLSEAAAQTCSNLYNSNRIDQLAKTARQSHSHVNHPMSVSVDVLGSIISAKNSTCPSFDEMPPISGGFTKPEVFAAGVMIDNILSQHIGFYSSDIQSSCKRGDL